MKLLKLLWVLLLVPITTHAADLEKELVGTDYLNSYRSYCQLTQQKMGLQREGVGSGVISQSESGLILTNYHVIHKAHKGQGVPMEG